MASTGQAQIIKTLKLEHLNQHMKLIGKNHKVKLLDTKKLKTINIRKHANSNCDDRVLIYYLSKTAILFSM